MSEMKALRDAYGETLAELGEKYDNLYVLDADLSKSTKTEIFAKKFPERFIECGIAEANMMSVASGMATCGKIVFASTFAMFAAGRAYEQIRNSIAYPHTNVKIVATHAGLTVGEDGATHQCLEDLALMRAIPGMVVISPSDAYQMKAAVRFACEYEGPVYIRAGRLAVPVVYDDGFVFTPGCYKKVADGENITLMYTGAFYETAMKVREILAKFNITLRVIDVPSIKPFAVDAVKEAAKDASMIVTLEDHNNIGGFGSAVCETLTSLDIPEKVRVLRLGSGDKFGKSGKAADVLARYGLDAKGVAKAIVAEKYPEFLDAIDAEF